MNIKILKLYFLKILIIFLVLLIDLLSKKFFYGNNFIIIPHVLGVRPSQLNTGGAWSILNDKMWLLILLSIIFIIFATVFDVFFRCKSKTYSVAFGFILGGTIGNLIDRIFLGGVRDFLFFDFYISYPTFNLADSFLLIGLILFIIFIVFIYNKDSKTGEGQKK